jgi:hypothetical protein
VQGKVRKTSKNLALGMSIMYKYASKQIKFEDFGQSVVLHMNPENRWIKRAESIP